MSCLFLFLVSFFLFFLWLFAAFYTSVSSVRRQFRWIIFIRKFPYGKKLIERECWVSFFFLYSVYFNFALNSISILLCGLCFVIAHSECCDNFNAGRHFICIDSTSAQYRYKHFCLFLKLNLNCVPIYHFSSFVSISFCRQTNWYPVNSDFYVNFELSSFINIENERIIEMDQLVKPSSIQQPTIMSQTKTMILQSTGNEFHYVTQPHLLADVKGS